MVVYLYMWNIQEYGKSLLTAIFFSSSSSSFLCYIHFSHLTICVSCIYGYNGTYTIVLVILFFFFQLSRMLYVAHLLFNFSFFFYYFLKYRSSKYNKSVPTMDLQLLFFSLSIISINYLSMHLSLLHHNHHHHHHHRPPPPPPTTTIYS